MDDYNDWSSDDNYWDDVYFEENYGSDCGGYGGGGSYCSVSSSGSGCSSNISSSSKSEPYQITGWGLFFLIVAKIACVIAMGPIAMYSLVFLALFPPLGLLGFYIVYAMFCFLFVPSKG